MTRSTLFSVAVVAAIAFAFGCRSRPDLPEYGTIGAFALTDQDGEPVTADGLRGETWIAAFMFTRCPTICPALTRSMKSVQERLAAAEAPVRLVSFSVDPDNDTPEVLKQYATEHGADLESWSFLTGDNRVVRQMAEDGFKLALSGTADPAKEHFGITHGSHLVLVDRNLRIRGYYRSSEEETLARLVEDATRLSR